MNKNDEIVTWENEPIERTLNALQNKGMTPKMLRAHEVLSDGRIPANALYKRDGKGGKPFDYVKHTWITRLFNDAFGTFWSWYGGEHVSVDPHDGSVAASGRVVVHMPLTHPDGSITFFDREILDWGAIEAFPVKNNNGDPVFHWDGAPVYTMSTGDRILSAISLAITRCAMRGFNIGIELREPADQGEITALDAWNVLLRYGKKFNFSKERVIEIIKSLGITNDTLMERYAEAYSAIYEASRNLEEAPDLG